FQKKQPDDESTPSTSNSQLDLFSGETNSDNSNTSLSTQTVNSNQQLSTELNVTSPSKEECGPCTDTAHVSLTTAIKRSCDSGLPEEDIPELGHHHIKGPPPHAFIRRSKEKPHLMIPVKSRLVPEEVFRKVCGSQAIYVFKDSQLESEVSPEKRPRLLEDSQDRPEEISRSKQKSRRRCFQCQTKLELVQQELGSCRCGNVALQDVYGDEEVQGMLIRFADDTKLGGIANTLEDRKKIQGDLGYVFCMLHRLPEQHDCTFDHMGRGREEAIMKMVKLDRKVGRSCQRIGEGCS
ncbi:AN1-type zinc finger protein 3, partial [Varanus komodoensis]